MQLCCRKQRQNESKGCCVCASCDVNDTRLGQSKCSDNNDSVGIYLPSSNVDVQDATDHPTGGGGGFHSINNTSSIHQYCMYTGSADYDSQTNLYKCKGYAKSARFVVEGGTITVPGFHHCVSAGYANPAVDAEYPVESWTYLVAGGAVAEISNSESCSSCSPNVSVTSDGLTDTMSVSPENPPAAFSGRVRSSVPTPEQ